MYLIGKAVKNVGVRTVFCGEGPNEMINDYGFIPQNEGYPDMEVNNTYFRQALTFGLKESDKQLGRGGLAVGLAKTVSPPHKQFEFFWNY